MTDIPTLLTPRLTLRAQRPDDTEPLMAAFADEGFSRFITRERRALSRAEAWRPIAVVPGMWAANGYGNWMVEERATGQPVGRLGPWNPEGWPDFEIGWSIFPQHQGKGYAAEGAAAALAWVRETLGRDYVIHLIDPANTASEKVATRLGATLTGSWDIPDVGSVNIWTTRWENFTRTEIYAQHLSAGA
ncbi:MAG TPA: GNAT family N-acetyltransferase [Allosphingosinicella sp.]|nr:GNAT family N-acetyltransferase [Allosphingosinicella sp.]